jgi:hypothetical protein
VHGTAVWQSSKCLARNFYLSLVEESNSLPYLQLEALETKTIYRTAGREAISSPSYQNIMTMSALVKS